MTFSLVSWAIAPVTGGLPTPETNGNAPPRSSARPATPESIGVSLILLAILPARSGFPATRTSGPIVALWKYPMPACELSSPLDESDPQPETAVESAVATATVARRDVVRMGLLGSDAGKVRPTKRQASAGGLRHV